MKNFYKKKQIFTTVYTMFTVNLSVVYIGLVQLETWVGRLALHPIILWSSWFFMVHSFTVVTPYSIYNQPLLFRMLEFSALATHSAQSESAQSTSSGQSNFLVTNLADWQSFISGFNFYNITNYSCLFIPLKIYYQRNFS